MTARTQPARPQPSAIEGLDRLELGSLPVGSDSGRRLRKAWTAVWPKLLAIALILVIWQIVHLTGWKSYVLKGPGAVLSDLWHQMQHGLLWQAIGITLRRAVMGYALGPLGVPAQSYRAHFERMGFTQELAHIDTLRDVRWVMKDGLFFKRDGVMTAEPFLHSGPTPPTSWRRQ